MLPLHLAVTLQKLKTYSRINQINLDNIQLFEVVNKYNERVQLVLKLNYYAFNRKTKKPTLNYIFVLIYLRAIQ